MRTLLQNNVVYLFFAVLAGISFFADAYTQYLINLMLVYVVIAQGLNLILGFAGMFAFAHGAFMGIGAYASALLVTRLGLPYFVALPAAGLVAAAVGCAVGIPAIRVSGLYLAMVTVGFTEIVQWVLLHWKSLTRGPDGISIPAPVAFGHVFRSDFSSFFIIATAALLMTFLAQFIVRSRIGRAFVALRDSEIAAQCSGVDIPRTKIIAFTVSAFYAGIGGSLFSLTQHFIAPENFNLVQTILHFCMVTIGGAATIVGPFIGAVIMTWLPELLRNVQALQEVGYGLLLIVFVIFVPRGVAGFLIDRGILPRERYAPVSARPEAGQPDARAGKAVQ